jgi:hypothetical protein
MRRRKRSVNSRWRNPKLTSSWTPAASRPRLQTFLGSRPRKPGRSQRRAGKPAACRLVDDAIAALQCPAANPHNRFDIPTAVKGHDPIRFRHPLHGQGFVKAVARDVQNPIALFFNALETIESMVLSCHGIRNITGSRLDPAGVGCHHQYPGASGAVQDDIVHAFLFRLSKLIEMEVSVHGDQIPGCRWSTDTPHRYRLSGDPLFQQGFHDLLIGRKSVRNSTHGG